MTSIQDIHAKAKAIDKIVGQNFRAFRLLKGFSQQYIAEGLGLTFQQIQKYEKGTSRLSAGKLYQTAHILGIPPEEFFKGLKAKKPNTSLPQQNFYLARSLDDIRPEVKSALLKLTTVLIEKH